MSTYSEIKSNLETAAPELNNTSAAAIFDNAANAIAGTIDTVLTEMENTQTVITDIIGKQRYGRELYYTNTAKAFQYGDNLSINAETLDYYYETIDETKQIVTQAAFEKFTDGGSQYLILKVAALDSTTEALRKLTTAEKSAFDTYFENFELPGLAVTKISSDPALFGFTAVCTYYTSYDLSALQVNMAEALNNFRNEFEYNGTLFVNDLETYITNNVPGVRNFSLSNTQMNEGSGYVAFTGSIKLAAGYFDYKPSITSYITYTSING